MLGLFILNLINEKFLMELTIIHLYYILKIIQYNLSKLTNLGMNMIKFQNKRFLGRYKNVKTEKLYNIYTGNKK